MATEHCRCRCRCKCTYGKNLRTLTFTSASTAFSGHPAADKYNQQTFNSFTPSVTAGFIAAEFDAQ
jgi:hypothetical protein